MVKRKTIRPTVGKNLSQILGDTLIKDWYDAISEFVCNSYDADAEVVHINLDADQKTLTIGDDGSGMNEEGLKHFFRLGDSQKIEEPISPIKKRKRVGKKGIAKTLLRYLGNSFSLDSVCGEQKYFIDEGVVKGDVQGIAVPVDIEINDGTTITIKNLRFDIGNGGFNLNGLVSRLQWDIPNKPDFDVYVNGKLVKKKRSNRICFGI